MTSRVNEGVLGQSDIASFIDHTALKPDTTEDQIVQLCNEALEFDFVAVCISSTWISIASRILNNSSQRIATVIGFPHGNTLSVVKEYEAKKAIEAGAHELDMVINIGALKSGDQKTVFQDIGSVVAAAEDKPGTFVKVIIETGLLTETEKVLGCQLAMDAGAHFVKTSTGFANSGATIGDVTLMRLTVGDRLGVKAAGGIKDLSTARAMIEAGASRLGCSSSVSIMKELLAAASRSEAAVR